MTMFRSWSIVNIAWMKQEMWWLKGYDQDGEENGGGKDDAEVSPGAV